MTTIIFDVGNVIVKADHSLTHTILEGYGVPAERAQTFFKNQHYDDFGRGKIGGRDFYDALIRDYLKFRLSYEQVVSAHDAHLYDVDTDVLNIMSRIPRGNLAILTNTNTWQTARVRQLIDLTLYSDRILMSNKIKMLKTDDGCFPSVVGKFETEHGKIWLVDDNLENILKAQEHGLGTIHFENAEQLIRELEAKSLL